MAKKVLVLTQRQADRLADLVNRRVREIGVVDVEGADADFTEIMSHLTDMEAIQEQLV
jgi:hypothetical protein